MDLPEHAAAEGGPDQGCDVGLVVQSARDLQDVVARSRDVREAVLLQGRVTRRLQRLQIGHTPIRGKIVWATPSFDHLFCALEGAGSELSPGRGPVIEPEQHLSLQSIKLHASNGRNRAHASGTFDVRVRVHGAPEPVRGARRLDLCMLLHRCFGGRVTDQRPALESELVLA